MAFPDDAMFDTLTIRPFQGQSAYGPLYGNEYDVPCCLDRSFKVITDSTGQIVTASLSGIFRAECTIKANDLAISGSQQYRAVMVNPQSLAGVVNHVEIDFVSVAG